MLHGVQLTIGFIHAEVSEVVLPWLSKLGLLFLRVTEKKTIFYADTMAQRLDFTNAFNTLTSDIVLCAIRSFPVLEKKDWCSLKRTSLQFHDRVIEPTKKVQQGDPFGQIVFAMPWPTDRQIFGHDAR